MRYLTAKQTADKWGLTVRRVQDLCKQGKISGSVRHGREWMIPEYSDKPMDMRKPCSKKQAHHAPIYHDGNYVLTAIGIYTRPGTADEVLASLEKAPPFYDMFKAQIMLYRGNSEDAKKLLLKYKDNTDFAVRSTIGMNLVMCATCEGDGGLWRQAMQFLVESETHSENQVVLRDFLIAANASTVDDMSYFPEWFRRGDFTPLPRQAMPLARYYYIKYLYIAAHEYKIDGDHGRRYAMDFLKQLPLVIEPLISQTHIEGALITEAGLRMMCAVAYHVGDDNQRATEHISKTLDLVLPDRLYLILAEYRHRLGSLLDTMLAERDPKALAEVKKMSKVVQVGWIRLHNQVRDRTIADNLSLREQQIAKLAVYGLANKEIAERLGISVNAVKQILRNVMDKTGATTRQELHKYL